MKFTYFPGNTSVTIEIDSLNFYSGFTDDPDKQDHSLTITVSEGVDIDKVIEEIHNSIIDKGYFDPTPHLKQSVRRAAEPEEGKWYSDDYKKNWKRMLYIIAKPGIRGLQDPSRFSIS